MYLPASSAADPGPPRYSARIIKASALLADTRLLLAHWDAGQSVGENLDRIRARNLLGKASRSRVEDILAIFRRRYLSSSAVANALSILVRADVPPQTLDRIFYFHAARSDALLHDVVTELLAPRYGQGLSEIPTDVVQAFVAERVREGSTAGVWSDPTTWRITRGLLATLRDFGILSGVVKKQLAPIYLSPVAFAYVAFILNRQIRSGERVLQSPEWRLFFLQPHQVEQFLVEAQQRHLLQYDAAGRIVRIDFPTDSIEEYARALAQRTD